MNSFQLMSKYRTNKNKIINDPVYGFITISSPLLFDIIQHPFFQRLRRIKQLGLTHLVYPGANHSRFQHALGAMHLMTIALDVLRKKGVVITDEEAESTKIAILLHDVGHGPFSHALEHSIIDGLNHEKISERIMEFLNSEFDGKLSMAIEIFNNLYKKKFLHQLVSGQLDVDRMDYLKRDTFFTGVSEGAISYERILKMLYVHNDQLVVEAKGIYSIEKFLVARRLMYWQVYLHKTVVSSEQLLMNILKRAKALATTNVALFASPSLNYFLYNSVDEEKFDNSRNEIIKRFAELDDNDIISAIKVWTKHDDFILSTLSGWLVDRTLYRIIIQKNKIDKEIQDNIKNKILLAYPIQEKEIPYFTFTSVLQNKTYTPCNENITIIDNKGFTQDISEASDLINVSVLAKAMKKYFICYPKEIEL